MFPEPTELLLIGCSIESVWTPKSKSNTLTPKINSQTYWQREISHVMNGIIFWCLFNISHLSSINSLEEMSNTRRCRWRKSHSQKIEADDEFGLAMQRKDSWRALPLLHQKARWKPDVKVKYLWARGLSSSQERTRLVSEQQAGLFTQHTDRFVVDEDDMDSNTVTESDFSL